MALETAQICILISFFSYLGPVTRKPVPGVCNKTTPKPTVNPENFARLLFSRMALKDIFATFKIRDLAKIYQYQ